MKNQTLYRGESKKAKETKAEKVYHFVQKMKRKAAILKKETVTIR